MKISSLTTTFLFFLVTVFIQSRAQNIPNPDFEDWTGSTPNGWVTPDGTIALFSKSTDHQSGLYAVKLTASGTQPGILYTGEALLPTSTKSLYLNGYIKASLSNSDSLLALAYFERNLDSVVGGGQDKTSTSSSSWTPFHVTLNFPANYTPDSFGVAIILFGSSSSVVYIDNLSFSNTPIGNELGISVPFGLMPIRKEQLLANIYPNPVSSDATISFSLADPANDISVKLLDISGRLVKTLLQNSSLAGEQNIRFSVDDLSDGLYFYEIRSENFSVSKKFIVSK